MMASEYRGCAAGIFFSAFWLPVFILGIFLHTESTASEYQEKAEFICTFAKFVQWPQDENADTPLQICILGRDFFGTEIRRMENKTVRGRPLSFRVCPDEKGTEDCHIVFLSASEKERLPAVLSLFRARPVLTVGDFPGFAAAGGIISLIRTGAQLRFEINTDAAHRSGLQISPHLLKLARIVTPQSEKDRSQ